MKRTDSYRHKRINFLQRSLNGYLWFFCGILWVLLAVCLVALTGFLIVYPLWYFASAYKNTYSLFALCILFLALLIWFAGRLREQIRAAGSFSAWLATRFLVTAKKLARFFIAILSLYGLIFLFARGYTLPAAGGVLVYLLFLGVILGGRRKSH